LIDANRAERLDVGRRTARPPPRRGPPGHAPRTARRRLGETGVRELGLERRPRLEQSRRRAARSSAAHAGDDQDAAFYIVAAFTGLRLGELRALRWRDLNFADRLVHVRRSFTHGRFKPYPKGRRQRSVPMTDQIIPPLDRLSQRKHFTEPDDLVFVGPTGAVIEESALRRRMWRALDAAGLKRIRIHDLRPFLLHDGGAGVSLDEVKAYAGHANVSMTERYVRHVPAHDAAARLSQGHRRSRAPSCAPNCRSGRELSATERHKSRGVEPHGPIYRES
jgi:integrase